MTFTQSVWAVDGAPISGELMRLFARFQTQHQSGIALPKDLEVRELATPGSSVRIFDGECIILGDAVSDLGTYYGNNVGQEEVAISPTDSSGGRSDLVAIQAHDPTYSGSQFQGTVKPRTDRIVYPEVFQNVDSEGVAQGEYNFVNIIPLAVIDIPASTSTITQDMIIDHRELALPLSKPWQDSIRHPQGSITTVTGSAGAGYVDWPSSYVSVDVPSWASVMDIDCIVRSARFNANGGTGQQNLYGNVRNRVNNTTEIGLGEYNHEWPGGQSRGQLTQASTINVEEWAGTSIGIDVQVNVQGRSNSEVLQADNGTSVVYHLFFRQRPAFNTA